MRSSARRTDKYSKKLRALVHPEQTTRYTPTAQGRIHLEYCVKNAAITPMLQFSYVAYLEELIKHNAATRIEEGTGIYSKWLNRGLDAELLQSVATCIGITVEPPPIPCSDWDNQEDCEDAGCFWWEDECHDGPEPPCEWSWKRKLTFSGNVSGTNLDNFPVLVHLTNANFDFAKAKTNGEDIRFIDSDTCPTDGVPLDHEIEYWSQGGQEAWVWVKVPRIDGGSAADFIYMFYGNAAAADGQNAAAVWSNGYLGVLHMKGDGTATLPDTLGAYDFTKFGIGQPANITGKIDGAQLFDGANDNALNSNLLDVFPSAVVISMWIKPTSGWTSAQPTNECFLYKANQALDMIYLIFQSSNGKVVSTLFSGPPPRILETTKTTWLAQFYHLSFHFGTGGMKIYIDGVLDVSNAITLVPANGTTTDFFLGSTNTPSIWTHCSMDEVRLSNVTRSTDWVQAQYRSQHETLITYGAEEPG